MFENKLTKAGQIHYSRYIASWYRSGGIFISIHGADGFVEWAMSVGATEEEANEMHEMACCGKMELEHSAEKFINERFDYGKENRTMLRHARGRARK